MTEVTPREDPTKQIRRAYILALGLIAFFTVTGHFITTHLSERQKVGAEISFQIGRQRALVQQIMIYAQNYQRMNEILDYNFMMQFLHEFDQGHKYISERVKEEHFLTGHTSEALFNIYFGMPFDLNSRAQEYMTTVREYAKYDPKIEDPERVKQRAELVQRVTSQANTVLTPGFDAAFENFQTETLEKITRFYSMQFSGVLFILAVLIAEAFFIFRPMIKRIKEHNRLMLRLALEDPLTGLRNRRAYMNQAGAELARARRDETPVTVALLDIDHFKSVNDTYGHDAGDTVLKHFSKIMKTAFRKSDVVGRIGGEEFAVLLPRINHDGALQILQRFRKTVETNPCKFKDSEGNPIALSYTVSIGYTGPAKIGDETIDELLAQADLGLYAAKEQGRNCVISED